MENFFNTFGTIIALASLFFSTFLFTMTSLMEPSVSKIGDPGTEVDFETSRRMRSTAVFLLIIATWFTVEEVCRDMRKMSKSIDAIKAAVIPSQPKVP